MSEEESSLVAAELQLSDTSAKSLRMGEPDLEITVKDGDKQKVFHHYSTIMAYNFGFFDSMLSSGMKESESKKVTIEDVDPGLFELATELLDDPCKSTDVPAEDMVKMGPLYHRLDSRPGLNLAEKALSSFLDDLIEDKNTQNHSKREMEVAIESILFGQEAHLGGLLTKSKLFLQKKFSRVGPSGRGLLTLPHIQRLQSFLAAYHEDVYQPFHDKFFQGLPLPDIGGPSFPEILASQFRAIENTTLPQYVEIQDLVCEVETFVENSSHEYIQLTTDDIGLKHIPSSHRYRGIKGLIVEVEVGQACLMSLEHGSAGSDFDFLDWCIIYKQQNTNSSAKMEFVYPGSGSCPMPPCGKGWRILNGIDPVGSRESYEVRLVCKPKAQRVELLNF